MNIWINIQSIKFSDGFAAKEAAANAAAANAAAQFSNAATQAKNFAIGMTSYLPGFKLASVALDPFFRVPPTINVVQQKAKNFANDVANGIGSCLPRLNSVEEDVRPTFNTPTINVVQQGDNEAGTPPPIAPTSGQGDNGSEGQGDNGSEGQGDNGSKGQGAETQLGQGENVADTPMQSLIEDTQSSSGHAPVDSVVGASAVAESAVGAPDQVETKPKLIRQGALVSSWLDCISPLFSCCYTDRANIQNDSDEIRVGKTPSTDAHNATGKSIGEDNTKSARTN